MMIEWISTHPRMTLGGLLLLLLAVAIWHAARLRRRQANGPSSGFQRLALVAQLTDNAVITADVHQRITWTNDAFSQITGHAARDALGRRLSELLRNERADATTWPRLCSALTSGQSMRAQLLSRRHDGADLWLDLNAHPLRDTAGRLCGFVCIATDITERRQAQIDLRIAALAFDSLDAIAITDAAQVILKINPAFTRITGYTAEEACGKVTGQLLRSGVQDGAFYAAMWQALRRDRHWQGEIWNRRKNGQLFSEWLSITAVTDEHDKVTNFVAVFADITAKKRADELVHRMAFEDPLTELPNRRLLLDRLELALANSARLQRHVAVLFIDLDRFKALNDSLGHDRGDRLLVEVARQLRRSVRESDTVARLGGDEFVVVLSSLSESAARAAQEAEAVACSVRTAIDRPFDLGGATWQCTPSIGIALGFGHDSTIEDLLKRADDAMYEAKRAAREAQHDVQPAAPHEGAPQAPQAY